MRRRSCATNTWRRYDTEGNLQWQRLCCSGDNFAGIDVSTDHAGNALVAGNSWNANFVREQAFLLKYDPMGNLQWQRTISSNGGSPPGSVHAVATAADFLGDALVAGYTDGGSLTTEPPAGDYDAFVRKFDALGNVLWTRQIATSRYDVASGVVTDALGNSFVAGVTGGSLFAANAGANDAFLVKYDRQGVLLWSRQFGTSDIDGVEAMAIDRSGDVYVAGGTYGDLLTANAGELDVFVRKYDADGVLQWTQQLGTTGEDNVDSITIDPLGRIYISGWTSGSLGAPNAGGYDAFLGLLDMEGSLLDVEQFGTPDFDRARAIVADGQHGALLTGFTGGDLFATHAGGGLDAFVAKYVYVPEPCSYSLLLMSAAVIIRRRQALCARFRSA